MIILKEEGGMLFPLRQNLFFPYIVSTLLVEEACTLAHYFVSRRPLNFKNFVIHTSSLFLYIYKVHYIQFF
jgi:hypothetical protein